MAESGTENIRGIDIDKIAKGFAEEQFIFKNDVTVAQTSAREIRWYQKTAGTLEGKKTDGYTDEAITDNNQLTQPTVQEQSWTRKTSYVKKFMLESPTISEEDIQDSDIDVLATNIRDLTRAVAYQVDNRIWNIMTENQSANDINSVSTKNPWDDTDQDPIQDIMDAKAKIREQGYDPDSGGTLYLNSTDAKNLISWLISEKGSNIPQWASEKVSQGTVGKMLGLNVKVNNNVTDDYAAVALPKTAVTFKQFSDITGTQLVDEGIGRKFRVWEEGEALLTDPKAVTLISDTQA